MTKGTKVGGCLARAAGLLGMGVAGLAIVIGAVALLDWMFGEDRKPTVKRVETVPQLAARLEPTVTEPAKPAPVAPARPSCSLGIPGHTGSVPVLPTEAGFEEYGKAAAQGLDDRSMLTVLGSNGGFLVERGTACLAVDTGFASSRVRVLAGPHSGKAGWVPNEWRVGR